jgi:hypothetical protein
MSATRTLRALTIDQVVDRLISVAGQHNEMDRTAELAEIRAEVVRRLRERKARQ